MTDARPTGNSPSQRDSPPRPFSHGPPRPDESQFTGERPGWGEGFDYDYARHLAAYNHALGMVAGLRVLDAGCGEGFGTQLLAASAREVVGIDYSADAIAECRRLWCGPHRPNLRFEHVDVLRQGGFAERFDLVLSFQVLEHIRDSSGFLAALAARLDAQGMLVLTTPNRLRTASENPYHVREYTDGELRRELERVFSRVAIHGIHGNDKVETFETQRARAVRRILRLDPLGVRNLLPRSVVEFAFAKLARVVRRSARGEVAIVPEDFLVRDDTERALDLLAVCSGGPAGASNS